MISRATPAFRPAGVFFAAAGPLSFLNSGHRTPGFEVQRPLRIVPMPAKRVMLDIATAILGLVSALIFAIHAVRRVCTEADIATEILDVGSAAQGVKPNQSRWSGWGLLQAPDMPVSRSTNGRNQP